MTEPRADASDPGTEDVFVFPTSFAQQRLWLLDQLEPGRATYNIPLNYRLRGPLDVTALRRAFEITVERHEVLRTTFEVRAGEPQQVVHPPSAFHLAVIDLSGDAGREKELLRLVDVEGNRPFDLVTGPLLRATVVRMAADDHALLLTVHHIAADGWSIGILERDLSAAYAAVLDGTESALPELPIQYADFTIWQRDQLAGSAYNVSIDYWKQQLAHPLPTIDLPSDRQRDPDRLRVAQKLPVRVPADASESVTALARSAGVTPFVVLLAVFQLLLRRYSGSEDVIVGTPIAGRTRVETEGLIGFFVNTLALRVNVGGSPSFRDLISRTRDVVLAGMAHQDVPFEQVVEAVEPERDRSRNPLFDALFSLQATTGSSASFALRGVAATRLGGARDTAKFDVQLILNATDSGFRGLLEYDADLFDERTMRGFGAHYTQLVAAAVRNPELPVERLPLMDDDERAATIARGAGRAVARDPKATVVSMVRAQIERTPNAIAVEMHGTTLTYAELATRAAGVSARLRENGVQRGDRVAIAAERSLDVVCAVLGVLEVGAGYVPIDPAYPEARTAYMLEQSKAKLLLASPKGAAQLPTHGTTLLFDGARAMRLATEVAPSDLAYVLYTSGSTGMPKGVAMGHGAMVNLLEWQRGDSAATVGTRTLQFASLSFDVSFQEIFSTWGTGGTLVLIDDDTRRDPRALVKLLARERVERMFLPFIALEHLADAAQQNRDALSLREIITAGEQLRVTPAIRTLAHRTGAILVNQYGPTETHVVTSLTLRGDPAEWPALPSIGRPIDNVTTLVLDSAGEPVPDGVPGELWLGGLALAHGYLDDEVRTAERFTGAPRGARVSRLYRTGDLSRVRSDGDLDYLGRADDQVKIRGFRVELGEIERVLSDSPLVTACAVRLWGESSAEKRLVAYVIPRGVESRDVLTTELRAWCRDRLPEFMVPAAYVSLEKLPLTPSGKVDRRSLPAPQESDTPGSRYRPPRTTIEHELVQIWERLLSKRPIGLDDDFFDIGGHSLLAVQMLAGVEQLRGRRVPLAWLFESSTIEALAARIGADVQAQREPPIVTLQENAHKTPLAFVHGDVRGGGWYCRRLAPLALPDSPMYVLPTIGVDDELRPWTIETMAARHVGELRKVQPHGPYRIAGFCIGGIIAFEIARQLRESGEDIDQLVLVDGAAMNARIRHLRPLLQLVRGPDENTRLTRQAVLMKRTRWYALRLRQITRRPAREQVAWAARIVGRLLPSSASRSAETHTPPPVASSTDFASALRTSIAQGPGTNVLLMQERAASVYVPGWYDGSIDLIWADAQPKPDAAKNTHGWSKFAREIRVHPVATSHLGLITADIPLFAEVLRSVLDRDGT